MAGSIVRPMADSIAGQRAALRRQLRQNRRQLSRAQQRQAARGLYRSLAQHPGFRRARSVALYLASDGEIDPGQLIKEALRRRKKVYLPVLARWPKNRMRFQQLARGEKLRPNRFAIAEPLAKSTRQKPAWAMDLVLLPLVGFDAHGGRLGMGGGFYDRCLAFRQRRQYRKPALWGLAHECQRVERLPLANWDIPLDAVMTDLACYVFGGNGQG